MLTGSHMTPTRHPHMAPACLPLQRCIRSDITCLISANRVRRNRFARAHPWLVHAPQVLCVALVDDDTLGALLPGGRAMAHRYGEEALSQGMHQRGGKPPAVPGARLLGGVLVLVVGLALAVSAHSLFGARLQWDSADGWHLHTEVAFTKAEFAAFLPRAMILGVLLGAMNLAWECIAAVMDAVRVWVHRRC